MNLPVRRRLVDNAVHAFLDGAIADPSGAIAVGLGELPTGVDFGDDNRRYIVVTPVPGVGVATGPPTNEEGDVELEYDVRSCAGLGRGQGGAQWIADEVRRIFFTRQAWGEPLYPLVIDKHAEMGRSTIGGAPAATLLDGEWQATDSIRVTVTRSS